MNLFFRMSLNPGVPIAGPIFTLALVAPTHQNNRSNPSSPT